MNHLKNQYEILLNENARLQSESLNLGSPQYEPLQVESKVSSFHHNFGEFRSTYGSGKENYWQNYDFERAKKNPNLSSQESTFKARNQRSGGYFKNWEKRKYRGFLKLTDSKKFIFLLILSMFVLIMNVFAYKKYV